MTPDELAKSGSEHGHQRAYFSELNTWSREVWDMTFAIPNGGSRGDDKQSRMIRGSHMKAEGVKRGVPDIMVAWPFKCNGVFYCGLYIEMKRPADREKDRAAGRLDKSNQEPWHERLRRRGYAVAVCYNWQEAMAATKAYFGAS